MPVRRELPSEVYWKKAARKTLELEKMIGGLGAAESAKDEVTKLQHSKELHGVETNFVMAGMVHAEQTNGLSAMDPKHLPSIVFSINNTLNTYDRLLKSIPTDKEHAQYAAFAKLRERILVERGTLLKDKKRLESRYFNLCR